ncbi:radical SAM protein [Streptomyces sp. NPDC001407]|uniref:radical SAM protein n=1 Tax=Streptomyces sp. NPDC001407 TaxID=3364573 RepID=UPI0036825727
MPTARPVPGPDDDVADGSVWLPLEDTDEHTAVSVICKLRGETCDVDCLYCFEKRKEAPGGAAITPEQITHLGRLFGSRPLTVELHGGEPLTIGKPAMAALLDELAAQPTVRRVHLQTNAVRLDDTWLDLFDAHYPRLHIGISLDGDEDGNSWRVGYDGTPLYPRVAAALNLLGKRGRTCGVITVVTSAVLGRAPAVLDHLAAFTAVRAINLVPAFDTSVTEPTAPVGTRPSPSRRLQQQALTTGTPAWAITPDQYAQFVLDAAAHWISTGHFRRIKLDPVVAAIRRLRGLDTTHCHFTNRKCSHVFTTYPGGRLGSCDELDWPQAHLLPLATATTEKDIVGAQHRNPLLTSGRALMDTCRTCPYHTTCGGGCTATRWRMRQSTGGDDAYCRHRARIIDGIAALLAAPDDPDGARCLRARWRPRIPNEMRDVPAFLARWDDPDAPREPARLRTSTHGNINSTGLPGVHEADDLDPRHPQWREGIEPGVWPLLNVITSWGAVTYDSCQGHPHTGTGLASAVYRVGLLPRTRDEYARLAARLCRTLTDADGYLPPAVTARLARTDLTSTTTGTRHPALELSLTPAPGATWADYFNGLAQAARTLTHVARHTNPTGPCGCAERPPRRRETP